jgi:tetratricopeptide (TPR) repeat protein
MPGRANTSISWGVRGLRRSTRERGPAADVRAWTGGVPKAGSLAVLLLVVPYTAAAAERQETIARDAPTVITDRMLMAGERHTYAVALQRGDALSGEVRQHGIDVVVTVATPDGKVAMDIDSPNGTDGPEPVIFVADVPGKHLIEVRPLEANARAGRYDVRLATPGQATARERQTFEGLRRHLEAMRLRNDGLGAQHAGNYPASRDLYARAERGARTALRLREKSFGPVHPDVATTHELLGLIYDEVGEYDRGESHFTKALNIRERLLGRDHPDLLTTQSDLGFLRLAAGNYAGAEILYARTLRRREELNGPDDPRVANVLVGLGESLLRQGKLDRAEEALRRARAVREKAAGPTHVSLAWIDNLLGRVFLARQRFPDAAASCGAARKTLEAATGSSRPLLATSLQCLGEAHLGSGDLPAAAALLDESLKLRESAVGSEHPWVAETLAAQAAVFNRQGQKRRAEEVMRRALQIREKKLGGRHPAVAETVRALAEIERERR